MRPKAERVLLDPLVAAVDGIMAASCGYARREGVHQCGSVNACSPADWAELKVAVEQAAVALVVDTLEKVLADGDLVAARQRLEYLVGEASRLCREQRAPHECRGCYDWMPCEGRPYLMRQGGRPL